MEKEKKNDYLSSLKALETENYLDRVFYRPLGYKIAKALQHTGVTPNAVTILSIFVGIVAGIVWWFPYDLTLAFVGVLSLILANILDCVDGQLARLTGIKSEVGRILDGFAGDLWFLLIYIAFAHRLNMEFNLPFEPWIYIAVIITSGVSHWNQASITDYYKTLHLLFISKDKGKEFESSASISERYAQMRPGVNKVITWGYIFYTKNQERFTPQLQKLMALIRVKYGKDIPESLREKLHGESLKLIPLMNFNTFNGRSFFLFISALFNVIWLYFIWEIIVLNIIRVIIVKRHERFCKDIAKTI